MQYSLFIGRYQCIPPHVGHLALIDKVLEEGKSVCIALRDTPVDKDNPYSVEERTKAFKDIYNGRVKVITLPDIAEVCYGRKVGYEVREIRLDEETEKISATEIRSKV